MSTKKPVASKWYHEPKWALVIGVTALLSAYAVGSRSLDTGSWQQYFMTLGLLILAANRLAHVAKGIFHRHAA